MPNLTRRLLLVLVWSAGWYFAAVDVRALAIPLLSAASMGGLLTHPQAKAPLVQEIAQSSLTILALLAIIVVAASLLLPSTVPTWWVSIRSYFFALVWLIFIIFMLCPAGQTRSHRDDV